MHIGLVEIALLKGLFKVVVHDRIDGANAIDGKTSGGYIVQSTSTVIGSSTRRGRK
jgi:hypothetical protein